MTPHEVLKKYFGYDEFRPGQLPIVESIIRGEDTLAVLPTGGGKSICFQVPGLVLGGTTVVISPLISLMQDQVEALLRKGIRAAAVNSAQATQVRQQTFEQVKNGSLQFLYVSPERLQTTHFQEVLKNWQPTRVIVDEAHCIAQWGHDFRPEYLQIAKCFPPNFRPPTAAFTATAPPTTRQEICNYLQLQSPTLHLSSFWRTNLRFDVHNCTSQSEQWWRVLRWIKKAPQEAGIIFTITRQQAEQTAEFLKRFEIHSLVYHGGLDATARASIQGAFLSNQAQVLCATNAFGMGVDKPNIRWVIHLGIPASLEQYYQEAGRAGRDQLPARCGLFWTEDDVDVQMEMIENSPDHQHRKHKQKLFRSMMRFVQTKSCRGSKLFSYFGESFNKKCHQCDRCLGHLYDWTNLERERWRKLIRVRSRLAWVAKVPPTYLWTTITLWYLILVWPTTVDQLAQIPGIGGGWLRQWAQKVLPIFGVTEDHWRVQQEDRQTSHD